MTGYNSQVGNGSYRIQYETDNPENYKLIQLLIRMQIDDEQQKRLKKEGRIIELPCKPGDMLYAIREFKSTNYNRVYSFQAPDITWIIENTVRFGRTIFLTKEEAEAHIAAKEKVGDAE